MMKILLKTPGRFLSRRYRLPDLSQREKKVHSQFGEDGIIAAIFGAIPPRSRFFVEFGIGPHWLDTKYAGGLEGNCVLLRKQGWKGVFFDAGSHPPEYDVIQEFITADNINDVFAAHGVPETVDIVSIDIDGQDWWVWNALRYRPTLIITEYNGHKGPEEAVTVPFDPDFRWDETDHYGASLRALDLLARRKQGLHARLFQRGERFLRAHRSAGHIRGLPLQRSLQARAAPREGPAGPALRGHPVVLKVRSLAHPAPPPRTQGHLF